MLQQFVSILLKRLLKKEIRLRPRLSTNSMSCAIIIYQGQWQFSRLTLLFGNKHYFLELFFYFLHAIDMLQARRLPESQSPVVCHVCLVGFL